MSEPASCGGKLRPVPQAPGPGLSMGKSSQGYRPAPVDEHGLWPWMHGRENKFGNFIRPRLPVNPVVIRGQIFLWKSASRIRGDCPDRTTRSVTLFTGASLIPYRIRD